MKSKSTQTKIQRRDNSGKELQRNAGTSRFKPFTQSVIKTVIISLVLSLFLLSSAETFAQILQRGIATTATGTTATISIPVPAGVVQGDVMIAAIAHILPSGGTAAEVTCTGWTPVDGTALSGSDSRRYGTVLYKVAGASEAGPYVFSTSSTCTSAGTIVAFSGVDVSGATPFDVPPGTISASGSAGTTLSATAITTVTSNVAVVMMGLGLGAVTANTNWTGWTTASPGTLTEISDFGNTSNTAFVGSAWAIKAAPGSTGVGGATATNPSYLGGILLALKRAANAFYVRTGGTYSASLQNVSSWTSGPAGSGGSSPANFTSADQVFNIGYNTITTASIGAGWTVSGTNSKIRLGDGTNACNFTVGSNYVLTAPVDIQSNSTLTLSTTGSLTAISLGTLATSSTVDYAGSAQTVIPKAYSNLTLSGSGSKIMTGTITVAGNLSITGAIASIGAGLNVTVGTLTLGGSNTLSGTWGSTASAATHTNNNFFALTTGIVTVSVSTGIEDRYGNSGLMMNNYPNPFTGNTTLSYTLPADGHVTFTVSNLAGQRVKTVIDEEETKGDYTQVIQVSEMKSGVYFGTLSLKTNGKEIVKTIRLLKGQ